MDAWQEHSVSPELRAELGPTSPRRGGLRLRTVSTFMASLGKKFIGEKTAMTAANAIGRGIESQRLFIASAMTAHASISVAPAVVGATVKSVRPFLDRNAVLAYMRAVRTRDLDCLPMEKAMTQRRGVHSAGSPTKTPRPTTAINPDGRTPVELPSNAPQTKQRTEEPSEPAETSSKQTQLPDKRLN